MQEGIRFGHELAFTYGPLGFLAFPEPYLGWTSVIALAFAGVIHLALATALLVLARRAFPLWAAVALAYLAAGTAAYLGVPERTLVLAFIAGVWLLGNKPAWPRPGLVALAWGIVAGISLLGKFNTGLVIAAIATMTASQLLRPWWRAPAMVICSAASTTLLVWLVMGQQLADVPAFVSLSVEEAAGYSSAMGLDPGPAIQWLLGAALITLVAWAALARIASRAWPGPARVLLVLIGLGVAFATFKGAFVRWHYLIWFATAVPVTFVLLWDMRARLPAAAVLGVMFAAFFAAAAVPPVQFLDPIPRVETAIDQLRAIVVPSLRHEALTYAMESMQEGYRLDPAFVGKVSPYTVHIDPWEAVVAFAFRDLRWRPLPVFQSYGVYTTALDDANADFLASAEAPERIIRMPPVGFDGRFAWFEQPAATVQMVCRYRQVDGAPLFARIPNRCGAEEQIGTVQASIGETVNVPTEPRPNRMILARIHGVESSITERLVALAWKADPWSITLNGTAAYRLVPGTAPDPHILSIPATVGWAAPFDYPTPVTTFSIGVGADGQASNDRLTIDFFSVEVAAP